MAKKPHAADDLDGSEFETKTEAEIRTEILDEMMEVRALCKLAGYPDMADELIKANASHADVMKALEEAKAADEDGDDEEKPFPPKDKGKGKSELNTRRTSGEGNRSRREPVAIDQNAIYNRFNGRK